MMMKMILGNLCECNGHDLRYNFTTMPSKAICAVCKSKFKFDLFSLEWYEVDKFDGERRSDDELCQSWFNVVN